MEFVFILGSICVIRLANQTEVCVCVAITQATPAALLEITKIHNGVDTNNDQALDLQEFLFAFGRPEDALLRQQMLEALECKMFISLSLYAAA